MWYSGRDIRFGDTEVWKGLMFYVREREGGWKGREVLRDVFVSYLSGNGIGVGSEDGMGSSMRYGYYLLI